MKKIAISLGDINGIGIELVLRNHNKISKLCKPIYCIDKKLLKQASKLLNLKIPKDFETYGKYKKCKIKPQQITKQSGYFSYQSFLTAINLAKEKKVSGICTLPIHKKAWQKAGIPYAGHTDMLRNIFKKDAIMMLGCSKMFVALFTEHIPLKDVSKQIKTKKLTKFFINFINSTNAKKVAVLGFNPHAGDNGVLGYEEKKINKAIKKVNKILGQDILKGSFVPDVVFTPNFRNNYKYFIAMYHDQGLIPLKALYFDEGINISLNLPIKRTSVDHGTAFDIAYKQDNNLLNKSYINAIKEL
jgi:4-hydroxythreonine-4-phosphate dehydrogenase